MNIESILPTLDELKDLSIDRIGKAKRSSPLCLLEHYYVDDTDKILFNSRTSRLKQYENFNTAPGFELAGPRENIFFNPAKLTCGIVTCGGLCPGLNDVIRAITLSLKLDYGVKEVLGFRYGYEGMSSEAKEEPMVLNEEVVKDIQHQGGTILGAGRGATSPQDRVDTLVKHNVRLLFVIGGDGTFAGAHNLVKEIKKRNLDISIIGLPKTIDNDIRCSDVTFGFGTSVEEARKAIAAAHEEARSAYNGIGLVKLMGRDSGFITGAASLANADVNFCLVPEVPFKLEGDGAFLDQLEKRLEQKRHAVIAVSEGAGQDLLEGARQKDASGNVLHADIGLFLKSVISEHFKSKKTPITIKYIDPSYMIRSVAANARDSIFCLLLGQMAVHAGMAGKTDMFIGYWNHHFTHVPFEVAIGKRKKINTDGLVWQTLIATTEQRHLSKDQVCAVNLKK